MTRKECLDKAAECVLKDRASKYGGVEDNFERIADLWEAYLHAPISALDVAMMMSLLKIARAKANPAHADSFVDLAGYAACGAECAGGKPVSAPKAESGCFQNGNDQPEEPEFKFRDRVQARLGDGVWRDAVVSDKEITCGKLWYTVKIADFTGYYSLQADDVRPAPKAEGCEEPEFKPGDKVRVFFCGKEAQNGIYLGEGPEGMKSWTCRVKTDDGEEGVCAKSIVKKLDVACSEQEFKFGDKVQADIGPNGKWEDAIYCRKDLNGMHLVKYDIDDEIVFQAREVRPCPILRAEGCEELVQRIKDANPAIYGAGTEEQ